MKKLSCHVIREEIKKMCIEAACILPNDVEIKLKNSIEEEPYELAKKTLSVLVENSDIAKKLSKPICQDTGMAFVYITIGQDVQIVDGILEEAIQSGVRDGYEI